MNASARRARPGQQGQQRRGGDPQRPAPRAAPAGRGDAPIASLVQRAYENVIRNAVKYTAPGTAVDVSLRVANGALDVSVADHGPGVPEDELAHIFEPFHRAGNGHPAPGFGLGLAIAQRALAAHGGSIGARLRPGGGLVVDLHLPLRDTPSPATPA